MRLLIFTVAIITGCKSTDFDFFYLTENREIQELHRVISHYRIENGNWPSDKDIENFKRTNNYLKRFSKVTLNENSDSTLNVLFRLHYEDFEDPIRSLEMTEVLTPLENGQYVGKIDLKNLVLQDNMQLGTRTKLKLDEKKKFREWERLRRTSRLLVIENTSTMEKINLKVGSRIYFFSRDNSLIMADSIFSENNGYKRDEWILSTINASDSTINIDITGAGILRRLVKLTSIDSLNIKSMPGTFKIVGVSDGKRNKN